MPLNDRRSWLLDDPAPGIDINAIPSVSTRALALISRSQSSLLTTDFLQIYGVVDILSALEYHYNNHIDALRRLPPLPGRAFDRVRHEAIAWLNRAAQLHYFFRSDLVRKRIGCPDTPRTDACLPFRHKHGAHRSIDKPRREDSEHLQHVQAFTMSSLGGSLWKPRAGSKELACLPSHATHVSFLQLQAPEGVHLDFALEVEHPAVAAEGYAVLVALFATQRDA